MDRARDGDVAALEELVRRHRDTAYRVALRICLNPADAEDAAQDAFVKVWRSVHAFRADAAFTTWLYRIVTNCALDRVSRRRDEPVAEVPETDRTDDDPVDRVVARDKLAAAAIALRGLTAEQRACWVLRELEGLAYDDIAEVLATTVPAVKSRLFRARTEIAEALARYERGA